MRIHLLLLLCTTTIFLLNCQNDAVIDSTVEEVVGSKIYQNVDKELWSYWESFEFEANVRGFKIDLETEGLVGIITEIDQEHVAGSCTFSSNQPRVIRIDQTIWSNLPTLYREFIVFHELGHCILIRDHDERTDAQGNCLSIMRSGLNGCKDYYNNQTRDFYLDELFENF